MTDASDHGRLMDDVYRYQRLFYDVTRKYYLLGRDHLIANMQVQPGDTVLEIACGTGRNLSAIRRAQPFARLHGLDISAQMLVTAHRKLGHRVMLARGDACDFDPQALFGVTAFDHVVFSYSLSMIPDWQRALSEGMRHLAPGGTLHVVDFGDQGDLPRWFRAALRAWLARFHVTPRDALPDALDRLATGPNTLTRHGLRRGYATYGRLTLGT